MLFFSQVPPQDTETCNNKNKTWYCLSDIFMYATHSTAAYDYIYVLRSQSVINTVWAY